MKRKLLSLALALCLILGMIPFPAQAEVIYSGTDSDYYSNTVSWTFTDDGTLTISGDGPMPFFDRSASPWWSFRNDVKTIVIQEGVTSIGEWAFQYFENVTSVSIPSTVETIDACAFKMCVSLTSVTIPEGVTSIGWTAFEQCESLTTLSLPNTLTSIDKMAFSDCVKLPEVNIPASVTFIGEAAFANCRSASGIYVDPANPNYCSDSYGVLYNKDMTSLMQAPGLFSGNYNIPSGVTSIEFAAFFQVHGLTGVTIPDSVEIIGNQAFAFSGITSVHVPASVSTIKKAFRGCSELTGITVSPDNPNFCNDASGVLFNKDMTTLSVAPGAISRHYQIPDGVLTIEEEAFENCGSLTEVTIPASVTEIGNFAFDDCSGLTQVYFLGDAPAFGQHSVFGSVTATCFYPTNNATWTWEVMQDYGGTLTWVVEGSSVVPDPSEPTDPVDPEPIENPFTDVKEKDYFFEPVLWAVDNGITSGVSANRFAPNDSCTRAQVVTFLWRAAGEPEPTSTRNPFKDVKSSAYYYKAVLWAVEKGITTGMSATSFGPNSPCTRGQVVTFLYRSAGTPEPTSGKNPFSDVKSSDFYYNAVLWAVGEGITTGISATRFGPGNTCTRAQVVTFLYRNFIN